MEDAFVSERAAGGVAVKDGEKWDETDLAEVRTARMNGRSVVAGFGPHRAGVQGPESYGTGWVFSMEIKTIT